MKISRESSICCLVSLLVTETKINEGTLPKHRTRKKNKYINVTQRQHIANLIWLQQQAKASWANSSNNLLLLFTAYACYINYFWNREKKYLILHNILINACNAWIMKKYYFWVCSCSATTWRRRKEVHFTPWLVTHFHIPTVVTHNTFSLWLIFHKTDKPPSSTESFFVKHDTI